MHDVSRLLRRRVDKAAQTIGLTSAQWRVLAYLGRAEGSNQASLADHMDMEPITLSRHLDRMEAGGMLERRPDPNDRRAHRLYLTDSGRKLIESFRSVTVDVMNDFTDGISDEEIATAIDILTRMRANLTGKTADAPPIAQRIPEKVFAQ
jgi:DNA-binding MarR family transcriptional regulator